MFIQNIATKPEKKTDDGNAISIVLPFKDQIAANVVRRQLWDLSNKIAITLQPPLRKKSGRGASVNSLNIIFPCTELVEELCDISQDP